MYRAVRDRGLSMLACCVALIGAKSIVLHGGGTFLPSHFDKVVQLGGGTGVSRIGIVTAAASTPVENGQWYIDQFISYGALEAYWIPVHILNITANSDPEVVANVQRMTGVMFGAGDQARIIQSLYNDGVESPVMAAIREVYEAGGGVMAGTSAGCAAMGAAPMIMGGLSWDALRYGAFEDGKQVRLDDLIYNPDGGIGILRGFITDTHFSERGREGRLVRLISDTSDRPNGVSRGIGVDENTALVLTDVDTATARGEMIGPRGAFLVDLTQSTVTGGDYWGIQSVYAQYLTDGDVIDMNTFDVTPAGWKSDLDGNEYYNEAETSERIFNGDRDNPLQPPHFVRVSRSPFDSRFDTFTTGRTQDTDPRFQVEFQQEAGSKGYGGYNALNDEWQITYTGLRINMVYL